VVPGDSTADGTLAGSVPADRVLEIDYQALVNNPQAVTRQMIAFCGLDWHDAYLSPELNERAVRTSSLWQLRQPIDRSRLERWWRYEPRLGELRELLPAIHRLSPTIIWLRPRARDVQSPAP
jgi:hypothetical protein